MPSATLPDLEELLAPVPGDNPCGVNLRSGTLFNQIRESRKRRIAPLSNDELPPDWEKVTELCLTGLAQSKDLELAAYLTEAWTHLDGFAGLLRGFGVINQLMDLYWDCLHPGIVDGDLQARVSPLVVITADKSGALLPGIVREIELVSPSAGDGTYSAQQWRLQQKRALNDSSDRAQSRQAAQEYLAKFEKAIADTPASYFQQILSEMEQCRAELERFKSQSLARFPVTIAPGPHAILESLSDCAALVRQFLVKKGFGQDEPADDTVAVAPTNGEATVEINGAPSPARTNGQIATRRDAFRRLDEIARYFKTNEPQTPVLALIERALRWETKSLDEVFSEIIKNQESLTQVFDVLGVKKD